MLADKREQRMSARLSDTAQIEHLHAVIQLSTEPRQVDAVNFYRRGRFPSTAPHFEFPYVVFSE